MEKKNPRPLCTEYKKYKFETDKMNSLDIKYQELLFEIITKGKTKKDRTGVGTRSIFGHQIRHKMSEGFPLLTTKKMYWKGIVTEMLWFLRGDTNIKFLVDNGCNIWNGDAFKNYISKTNEYKGDWPDTMEEFINKIKTDDKFANKWGDLGPIYGKQWRSWTKYEQNTKVSGTYDEAVVDQFANLINDLKTNPDSRRLMVSAWNVGELDQMTLPPCHYGFQIYTRELNSGERRDWVIKNRNHQMPKFFDRLGWEGNVDEVLEEFNAPTRAISLMWNQRSVDTFLGLPFNIASYGLLLEIIAQEVNMIPDELIGNLGDVHLYENHLSQAREQLIREPYSLPSLNFNTEWWEGSLFDRVYSDDFCKCLIEEDIQLGNYQSHPPIKADLNN